MRGRADDAGLNEPVIGPSELIERLLITIEETEIPKSIWGPFLQAVERWEQHQSAACEHGVAKGDWCQPCNAEYKLAAAESESPCDCNIPMLEGAGQHAPGCAVLGVTMRAGS